MLVPFLSASSQNVLVLVPYFSALALSEKIYCLALNFLNGENQIRNQRRMVYMSRMVYRILTEIWGGPCVNIGRGISLCR